MEKRDILIVVAGVAIVIAMAFFIKPAMTGKQPDLSIPFLEPEPTVTPATLPTPYPSQTQRTTTVPTPSAVPTWSGQSKDLGFVAPPVTSYSPTVTPTHITPPEVTPEQDVMVTYATIEGRSGGITETLTMPFPYWELEYTVSPWEDRFVGTTSSKPAGVAESFGAEVFPSFSIEVVNADDPTEIIRTIEPQGGLNPDLWEKGDEYDPRPWTEKFYEGSSVRNYYFNVKTHMIQSYHIEIKVPERYLGKY